MANAKVLGAQFKHLRKQRGLTQIDTAAEIGVARSTIASIERGHDLPGRETLAALARFFRVSLDALEAGKIAVQTQSNSQVVDDLDELALLDLWRRMSVGMRHALMSMARENAQFIRDVDLTGKPNVA